MPTCEDFLCLNIIKFVTFSTILVYINNKNIFFSFIVKLLLLFISYLGVGETTKDS